jgi:glycerol-3-phosphate acyltransferase PlsY
MIQHISLVIAAYLIGSISSAIVLCKLAGLPDPRSQGSGNPGATNVLRFGGKSLAAVTLLGDILKGAIPVLIARVLEVPDLILALVCFAAFIGHLYPVYFAFQGGKGVATALGVITALSWPSGLALMGTWLVMAVISRISSLSALTAATLSPVYIYLFTDSLDFTAMAIAMTAFLIYRHRANIRRLLAGEEPRIGKKARTH